MRTKLYGKMEDKRTEKLDLLLKTKSYHQLDDDDKVIVKELLGDRDDYERFRSLILPIVMEQRMTVDKGVKQALIHKMKSKNKKQGWGFFNYKIPAYMAVLLLFLFTMAVYTFAPTKEVFVEKIVTIPSVPVVDTVLVESQPDTVFVEKIVRVKVPIYLVAEKEKPEVKPRTKETNLSGKSLADQKELRSLLGQSGE